MVEYDRNVIHEFAERLYLKANFIAWVYSIFGLLIGLIVGVIVSPHVHLYWGFGSILGIVIGLNVGKDKSFQYKLQAQTALCQAKIEQNTSKHY